MSAGTIGGMDPYRNLRDGLGLGASMIGGVIACNSCFGPVITSGPEEVVNSLVFQSIVGAILGCVVWKCHVWGRNYKPPPE